MGRRSGYSYPQKAALLTGSRHGLARQVALYGSGQMEQPPDTQLAAGPTSIARRTTSVLSSGVNRLAGDVRHLNVFLCDTGRLSPGRPEDSLRHRERQVVPVGTRVQPTRSTPDLHRVSVTSRSDRYVEHLSAYEWHGVLGDQPMIGVNSTKSSSRGTTSRAPQQVPHFLRPGDMVLQKSDLVSGVSVHTFIRA